jgi:hypothetical protein
MSEHHIEERTTNKYQSLLMSIKRGTGFTNQKIAERLQVSKSSIWRWTTDNPKYAGQPKSEQTQQDIEDWANSLQKFVPMRWKWDSKTQDLEIPIEVWRRGLHGIGGIADYICTEFARSWAQTRNDPISAEQIYYEQHLEGFERVLEKEIRATYDAKRKAITP